MCDKNEHKKTGYLSQQELLECKGFPSETRFKKGPVAIVECIQEIPCNPCESACPKGAIVIGNKITTPPTLLEEKCVGCGLCIAKCPGLAIFVEDHTFSDKEALVSFPYEFLPLPEKGAIIQGVDRAGRTVCKGVVFQVRSSKEMDSTTVVTVRLEKEFAHHVRSIKRW